jgi:hypothetical protein
MYEVDDRDRVVQLKEVPQSSVGAPNPWLIADEHRVVLAYYKQEREFWQETDKPRMVSASSEGESVAMVRFSLCYAHMFGPPNDEAFRGHPLAGRGLRPYGVFRVEESSWIRKLEKMNSVHSRHKPERFWKRQHLIFTFHDSTFECVCDGFDMREARGSILIALPKMVQFLQGGAP